MKKSIKVSIFIMFSIIIMFISMLKFTRVEYRYDPSKEIKVASPEIVTVGCFYLIDKKSCESPSPYNLPNDSSYIVSIKTANVINFITTYGNNLWKEEYYCYNQEKERVKLANKSLQSGVACDSKYEEIFQ